MGDHADDLYFREIQQRDSMHSVKTMAAWKTRSGKRIQFCDMDDDHLMNVCNMLNSRGIKCDGVWVIGILPDTLLHEIKKRELR